MVGDEICGAVVSVRPNVSYSCIYSKKTLVVKKIFDMEENVSVHVQSIYHVQVCHLLVVFKAKSNDYG